MGPVLNLGQGNPFLTSHITASTLCQQARYPVEIKKNFSLPLFLGLSVVTKVRDPEVTIINLKLCRTFGPAVAVTILEG